MPVVVCPNCKNRMLKPSPACPRCGYALPSSLFSSATSTASATMSSTLPSPAPLPSPFTTAARATKSSPPIASTGSTSVVPTKPASAPVSSIPSPSALHRATSIRGIIIDPPSTFEMPRRIDWSHIVIGLSFIPFSLIFLLAFFARRDMPDSRTLVTRVRVQEPGGGMRDARIEGDLMGAGVAQGDDVTLSGKDRGGALVIDSGYNHSVKGNLLIHQRHSPLAARIAAGIIIGIWVCALLCLLSSLTSAGSTYH